MGTFKAERLKFAKHFTLLLMKQRTRSMFEHPRSCSPGLSPVWQEEDGITSPTVSLTRGTSLRSCCVSSFSFLCHFPVNVALSIPCPHLKLLTSQSCSSTLCGPSTTCFSLSRPVQDGAQHKCCIHNRKKIYRKIWWWLDQFRSFSLS